MMSPDQKQMLLHILNSCDIENIDLKNGGNLYFLLKKRYMGYIVYYITGNYYFLPEKSYNKNIKCLFTHTINFNNHPLLPLLKSDDLETKILAVNLLISLNYDCKKIKINTKNIN